MRFRTWPKPTAYVETSRKRAPWHLIPSVHKKTARIQALEARLRALEEEVADLNRGRSSTTRVDPAFYRLLEDRYRGDEASVRARVQPYATEIAGYRAALAEAAWADFKVADLGCGRGELLSALAGAGIRAIGVDSNAEQTRGADIAGQEVVIASKAAGT